MVTASLIRMHKVVVMGVVSKTDFANHLTNYHKWFFVAFVAAYTCNDNIPWAVNNDLAYGFAAAHISGKSESDWCCECYELTFTSGPVSGKKMVVQVTNTGGDLGVSRLVVYFTLEVCNFNLKKLELGKSF